MRVWITGLVLLLLSACGQGESIPETPICTGPTNTEMVRIPGADRRHPCRPSEKTDSQENVPVVQIAYEDALAYAGWAGMELPSEEQWEYAARGEEVPRPEPRDASGAPQANYYQCAFPARDLGEDGFTTGASVGCFNPNGYGFYDMLGNVGNGPLETGSVRMPAKVRR